MHKRALIALAGRFIPMASREAINVNFTLNTISLFLRPKIANGYQVHLVVQLPSLQPIPLMSPRLNPLMSPRRSPRPSLRRSPRRSPRPSLHRSPRRSPRQSPPTSLRPSPLSRPLLKSLHLLLRQCRSHSVPIANLTSFG